MIRNILYVGYALCFIGLSSCASVVKNEETSELINAHTNKGLSAQELAFGECGIFLWDRTALPSFVFFHKQGEISAKFYVQGIVNILQTDQNTAVMADSGALNYTYSNADFETVILKGTLGEILESGQKISGATIKIKKANSWEEIHPVSGVYVCR